MNSPKYRAHRFILKRPTAGMRGSPHSSRGRLRLNHRPLDAFYRFCLGSFRLSADPDAACKGQALAIRRALHMDFLARPIRGGGEKKRYRIVKTRSVIG